MARPQTKAGLRAHAATLGATVRQIRLAQGAQLGTVAEATGTDSSVLSRFERGEKALGAESLLGVVAWCGGGDLASGLDLVADRLRDPEGAAAVDERYRRLETRWKRRKRHARWRQARRSTTKSAKKSGREAPK